MLEASDKKISEKLTTVTLNNIKIIILFIFLIQKGFTQVKHGTFSDDRFETGIDLNHYEDYLKVKSAFVCEIQSKEVVEDVEYITAVVLRVFKGKVEKTIKIKNKYFKNDPAHNPATIKTGEVLLMLLSKHFGSYHLKKCKYSVSSTEGKFTEDTTIFGQYGKVNGYVDLPLAKGQVVNGKREGEWQLESGGGYEWLFLETGKYKNGKKEGEWIIYSHKENEQFKRDSSYEADYKNKKDHYRPHGKHHYKAHFRSAVETYHHGKITGIFYSYWSNGVLCEQTIYKNDEANGLSIMYHDNGKIFSRALLEGENTKTYVEYRDSCIFETQSTLRKNRKMILSKDSVLQTEIIEKHGKGVFLAYHNNGKVKIKSAFNKKGSLVGNFITYDPSGKIISTRKLSDDTRLIGDELWNYFPDHGL